jgi:hypothetical protein
VSYESQAPVTRGIPGAFADGAVAPLYWNGLVLVAANDSRLMFCLKPLRADRLR